MLKILVCYPHAQKTITFALQLIDQIYLISEDHGGTRIYRLNQGSIERAIIALYHTEVVSLAR